MNQQPVKIIILFLALMAAAAMVFRKDMHLLMNPGDRFAIADTASVDRIEILSSDTVVLTRFGNVWLLNGTYAAGKTAVDNFLFSFSRLKTTGITTDPGLAAATGIKVRIHSGSGESRMVYYKTGKTSLLQKEGARKFYPAGVYGYPEIDLATVINPSPDHWQDKTLFNLQPGQIRSLTVIHPADPAKDFGIRITGGVPVLFIPGSGQQDTVPGTDREKMDFFCTYFTNIFYDHADTTGFKPSGDPEWIVSVCDTAGTESRLAVYPITRGNQTDIFRAMARHNNRDSFLLIRYMAVDLILQERKHFTRN